MICRLFVTKCFWIGYFAFAPSTSTHPPAQHESTSPNVCQVVVFGFELTSLWETSVLPSSTVVSASSSVTEVTEMLFPKKRKKRNGPGLERLPPEWWKSTDTRQKKSFGQMFVCHCQATVVGVLEVEVSGCSLVPQVCAILNRWRGGTRTRVCLLAWLKWCTYCRCLKKHLKVSLIAVSVEQSIYLFLTRCCLLPILPRTLQRHPCPLGRQNYFNKDGDGRGSRVRI